MTQQNEPQSTRKTGQKTTKEIGAAAEEIVAKYLTSNHWEILERNFYIRGGEVDIIAKDPNHILVFVEVKLRSSNYFGEGVEQFTIQKRKRVKKAGLSYLQICQERYTSIRFDFISLGQHNAKWWIKHFKNVELT
ncbi:MAG: YraN family protein [Candidatus Peregrinibacteria bacterium]|nr:YraN family protein [Candidatus Peregrinibacteria bacterium]